jgi:transposase
VEVRDRQPRRGPPARDDATRRGAQAGELQRAGLGRINRAPSAFAALCGTNPVPASSGKTSRHRLNRGGDRAANAALHRAVVTRMHWHEPTKAYLARRTAEGKTKPEIMRCLKRYLAREVYRALVPTRPAPAADTTSKKDLARAA